MSMSWEYNCERCGKEYTVMHPEPYGFKSICIECWTDKDEKDLNLYWKKYDEKEKERLASTKLEKIPKWVRRLFGAIDH